MGELVQVPRELLKLLLAGFLFGLTREERSRTSELLKAFGLPYAAGPGKRSSDHG